MLNTLRAGEYFGENSLLEGSPSRSVSIRCATPVEVLSLSKDDFIAGFGAHDATATAPPALARRHSSGAAEEELRASLISFIRMVSPQQRRVLCEGEAVFTAGDPADR